VIEREEIEQIRDIDVDLIADRNKCRKTNPATGAPFRHSGDNGTRLGDKRDIAGSRHTGRKAGVTTDAAAGRVASAPTRSPFTPDNGPDLIRQCVPKKGLFHNRDSGGVRVPVEIKRWERGDHDDWRSDPARAHLPHQFEPVHAL